VELSKNARIVLEKRYLKKVDGQVVESPEDMLRRVADNIAGVEVTTYKRSEEEAKKVSEQFFSLMDSGEFMPNSPTLMNAGRELQQLSACFVLPIEDSMISIFDTLKHAALIHQSGGGTGFAFSRLRPKNDIVRSTGGVASGPISFMKVYDSATNAVKQGGARRGANMGILRIDHPDVIDFIVAKENNEEITNFNISVGITREFMEALESGGMYNLYNPRSREKVGELDAQEVFDLVVQMAWKNGEPGVIFLDKINDHNPTPHIGEIESTNPCGEQPLLPYESCNLGSINLALMVKEKGKRVVVDYERMAKAIHTAVHFLDNVIDANKWPLEEIGELTRANRKIGLGVMGWAEMLFKLGIPYDSEEALELAEDVMAFIEKEGRAKSIELAKDRGTFPNWKGSLYDGNIKLRNATITTIAPTGTISIIANTSSGIEPLFGLAFTRNVLDGEALVEVNPVFEEVARKEGFYSSELMQRIAEVGSLADIEEIPEHIKRVFVTAHDISPEYHIRMQAAFQKHVDNAVSKTVNLPHDASKEDVRDIYLMAYDLDCKGVTVYRDGSRDAQVLSVGKKETKTEVHSVNGNWGGIKPIPRPRRLQGLTDRRETPVGNLYLTINSMDGHPFELFAQIGKAGSDVSAFTEALARMASLAFRSGIDPYEVVDQLAGIGGSRSVGFGPNRVRSVPDAIGQFLKEFLENNEAAGIYHQLDVSELLVTEEREESSQEKSLYDICPSCGMQSLVHVEGCVKCVACGYSEC